MPKPIPNAEQEVDRYLVLSNLRAQREIMLARARLRKRLSHYQQSMAAPASFTLFGVSIHLGRKEAEVTSNEIQQITKQLKALEDQLKILVSAAAKFPVPLLTDPALGKELAAEPLTIKVNGEQASTMRRGARR